MPTLAELEAAYPEYLKLYEACDGRYKDIIGAFTVSPSCLKCNTLNKSSQDKYRCRVMGSCIGITLSKELIRQLNLHMGWIE